MRIYPTHKKVLRIRNNAEKFLFGLTANTLDQPFNAFVNIHGRIIATFEQLKVGADEFLLLVEEPFVDPLLQHVARYLPLSQTQMIPENYHVLFDLDNQYKIGPQEFFIPHKKGQLIITSSAVVSNLPLEEFTHFRLDNNIPIQGIDYHDEFILNVSETDFVSFTKGCFLGQEPVAKVYNRSKPSWKLLVRYADECGEAEQSKMTSQVRGADGRTRGFVFVKNV